MENRLYFGIDLDDANAVISYYELNKPEPVTACTVAGSGVFQIPVLLARDRKGKQWVIGEEAAAAAKAGRMTIDRLLSRAGEGETVSFDEEKHSAAELLAIYLKRLIALAGSPGMPQTPDRLIICIERLSREATELFGEVARWMELPEGVLTLLDRKECAYYFVYHQSGEMNLHDVFVFDYRGDQLISRCLMKSPRTVPQLITIEEKEYRPGAGNLDIAFLRILEEQFHGRIVSGVYLTGSGFDGGWMKRSTVFMCKGRRAFVGKNLYSKGACYAAAVLDGQEDWQYVYLGDSEMKINVSIRVRNQGRDEFFTLISAGDNWYEALGECEVLLDGTPEISFWLQPPRSREARLEKLGLGGLAERPNRTTRLRIVAKPVSDIRVQIRIIDLGFGEIFRSSDMSWEHVLSYENYIRL